MRHREPAAGAAEWPYAGVATQTLALHPDRLELRLVVGANEGAVFPASIGWHPWFEKPDDFDFRPLAMYRCDDTGLPTGELVLPPTPPWDDCFIAHEPVRLFYSREVAAVITVSSDTDHWVVYDKPADATCVEPQTGPPDAPTLRPQVVAPDRPLELAMTIAW